MDVYTLWGQTVKSVVNRYAKGQSKEIQEDYTQECFVELISVTDVIDRFTTDRGPVFAKNYVYGICRKTIADLVNKDLKLTDHLSLSDQSVSEEVERIDSPKTDFGVSEQDLDEAVKQLPRVEQHIIRGLYFHSMTEDNLAISLSKSRRWVRNVRQDAVEQLRQILERK